MYGQLLSGVQVCTITKDVTTQVNMASPVQCKCVIDELIDDPPLIQDSDDDYSPTDDQHDEYVNGFTLFSCDDYECYAWFFTFINIYTTVHCEK